MQDTIHEGDQELVALSQFGLARIAVAKNNIEEARRLASDEPEIAGSNGKQKCKRSQRHG